MQGFVRRRWKISAGEKGCRHDWTDDTCCKCSAKRRLVEPPWYCYWTVVDPSTGAKQCSAGGFRTKKEAQAKLGEVIGSAQAGTYRPDDSKLTVSQLLADWLAARKSEGLRPGTISMYNDVVNGWIVPNVGALKVAQLNATVAGQLVDKLRSGEGSRLGRGPLSDRSVQLALGTLKAATLWAARPDGPLSRDVLAAFKRPRIRKSDRASSAWSAEEAGQFLATAGDDRLRALWWLLLARGLRRGELCGLRWSTVNWEAKTLAIVSTRVMVDNITTESDPKTSAGVRAVPLDDDLITEFRSHRKRQLEERLRAGEGWSDTGYVFVNELGEPISPQYVSRHFGTLCARAGVRRLRLHDGRHSAATMLLDDGTPVHIVSKMLGHSKPSITLDVYTHAINGGGAEAGSRLTGRLSSAAGGAGALQ